MHASHLIWMCPWGRCMGQVHSCTACLHLVCVAAVVRCCRPHRSSVPHVLVQVRNGWIQAPALIAEQLHAQPDNTIWRHTGNIVLYSIIPQ